MKKGFFIATGAAAPALIGMIAFAAIRKRYQFKISDLLIFSGLAIAGGFLASNMLKDQDKDLKDKV